MAGTDRALDNPPLTQVSLRWITGLAVPALRPVGNMIRWTDLLQVGLTSHLAREDSRRRANQRQSDHLRQSGISLILLTGGRRKITLTPRDTVFLNIRNGTWSAPINPPRSIVASSSERSLQCVINCKMRMDFRVYSSLRRTWGLEQRGLLLCVSLSRILLRECIL